MDAPYDAASAVDDLDHAIIHALRIDGRAPFSRIADVLGVSTQTVARRYRRMSSAFVLRVVGVVNPRRPSGEKWVLRLTASPNTAERVAQSLARRTDTSWVRRMSGGSEICCIMATSAASHHSLLLQEIPRAPSISAVSAHRLLHTYLGGPTAWQGHTTALTVAQQDQFREGVTTPNDEPDVEVGACATPADWELLTALQRNGRTSFTDLAAETGLSTSTVTRRLAALQAGGMLSFDVEVEAGVYGITTQALLWMSVAPAHLDETARSLIEGKELAFLASTTGSTNLVALVLCRTPAELHDYLAHGLGALDSIRTLETSPVQRTLKMSSPYLRSGPPR
ncbi:Lrp/AsnC family transcriptional regulator [Luteimicrobium subarcticum]|uniref:DNA-binding Lrp family transcriptional regulator n=1 Tax=Luteimicrobium subarcticum TaxID=620910 RepID=A0A2M8WJK3_9MICO|nr:AsnC family transcriptional regulator [Luteimicrobium subarcticum]PJI91105.1 DNA-binding Lrp family transcriptional regulator [Luteimicrobium subarcticum]